MDLQQTLLIVQQQSSMRDQWRLAGNLDRGCIITPGMPRDSGLIDSIAIYERGRNRNDNARTME